MSARLPNVVHGDGGIGRVPSQTGFRRAVPPLSRDAGSRSRIPAAAPARQCRSATCRLAGIIARTIAFLLLAACARAHTTDSSYARVRIFEDRLEVRLTCDVFTLLKIVPGLDANRDMALSRDELRSAAPEIRKFLAARVGVEVNGTVVKLTGDLEPFWPLDAPDPIPAKHWHVTESLVSFPFNIPLQTPPKDVSLLFDVFAFLGDRHVVLGVFEYRGRQTDVVFTAAEPDFIFDTAFAAPGDPPVVKPPAGKEPDGGEAQSAPRRSNADDSPAWRYFKMGIEHILTGYDHLCFLLALLVVSRLRPLILIVTSFTVAHTITLLLAAFQIVTLPTRLIECAIALTIIYVAVENLLRSDYGRRWMLTFFFGLIHGFGFANTLDPQKLPTEAEARCLLVFNLGVEVGQLAIVLVLLPLALGIAKWRYGGRAKIALSIVVAVLGLAWFVDRLFALGLMPF